MSVGVDFNFIPMGDCLWLVFTTLPNLAIAEEIAQHLVKNQLVACAQVLPPMTSIYTWQGQICRESEVLLLLKTPSDRYPALELSLKELHPYAEPEIIALVAAAVSQSYLTWAIASTH
ncbi:MAG: divalent-cation tolerance protein CutA [Pseudanabaenaceae cyanobacterium bins.68]|nr:divalent-cation tolerance protein CutA [Pseudanabaenaceae cyanobacterium bins.68]